MSKSTRGKLRPSRDEEDDMPKIRDVGLIDNPRSFVFYGRPGVGKTTLFGSFPKPSLLLDFNDKGTDSVADIKGLQVAQIERMKQIDAIYKMLKKGSKYASVCFDTVSQMQVLAMREMVGDDRDLRKWGGLTRSEFGQIASNLMALITKFRDLPIEVVFLAQERYFHLPDEDSMAGDDILAPELGANMMPSVAKYLNSQVTMIGQCYIRHRVIKADKTKKKKNKIQYCLWVGPDPVRTTKIRKPRSVVPPDFLIDPTYEDLISTIKGE